MDILDQMIDDLSEKAQPPKRIIEPGFEKQSKLNHVRQDLLTRGEKRKLNRKPERILEVEEKLTLDGLRLRETLDPGRFYKNKATEKISNDFQIGTIIEHPIDFYSSKATRKERKQTLIDELIEDKNKVLRKRYHRLKASDAIKKKEKALAERRKILQAKKKQDGNKLKVPSKKRVNKR